jgi:hypothetical protein
MSRLTGWKLIDEARPLTRLDRSRLFGLSGMHDTYIINWRISRQNQVGSWHRGVHTSITLVRIGYKGSLAKWSSRWISPWTTLRNFLQTWSITHPEYYCWRSSFLSSLSPAWHLNTPSNRRRLSPTWALYLVVWLFPGHISVLDDCTPSHQMLKMPVIVLVVPSTLVRDRFKGLRTVLPRYGDRIISYSKLMAPRERSNPWAY